MELLAVADCLEAFLCLPPQPRRDFFSPTAALAVGCVDASGSLALDVGEIDLLTTEVDEFDELLDEDLKLELTVSTRRLFREPLSRRW